MYYLKKVDCKYCTAGFETTKVITNRAKLKHMDSDFCIHYEKDNPFFYDINLCPNCGYAFHASFKNINDLYKSELEEKYIKRINLTDLTGVRTIQDALRALQLALVTAEITRERNIMIADICLKIAWIYRFKENKDQENRFLQLALSFFEKSLSEDNLKRENIDEDKLIFMIAELNSRLDNYTEARRWFSYLITNETVSKRYKNYALNRWQDYRHDN